MRDLSSRFASLASAYVARLLRAPQNLLQTCHWHVCLTQIPLAGFKSRASSKTQNGPLLGPDHFWWSMRDLNPRPCACKAHLPLFWFPCVPLFSQVVRMWRSGFPSLTPKTFAPTFAPKFARIQGYPGGGDRLRRIWAVNPYPYFRNQKRRLLLPVENADMVKSGSVFLVAIDTGCLYQIGQIVTHQFGKFCVIGIACGHF